MPENLEHSPTALSSRADSPPVREGTDEKRKRTLRSPEPPEPGTRGPTETFKRVTVRELKP